mgnify:CR=1 FL=1
MNILITERDEIIENIQLIRQTVCNVTTLEQEQDKLRSEMEIVVELTQSCVAENARTAQNQEDYQKPNNQKTKPNKNQKAVRDILRTASFHSKRRKEL